MRGPSATGGALRLLAVTMLLGLGACVTSGTHKEVVTERDELARSKRSLEARVNRLETSNASLDAERVRLIEEVEDQSQALEGLKEERAELETQVGALREAEAELSESLAISQSELDAQTQEVEELKGTYQGLVGDLESEVAAGQIEIEQLREGVRVAVSDEILFASGSAKLGADGRGVLSKVAERLQGMSYKVDVQGHTDSVPISSRLSDRYPSNWELAAARASSVVRLFLESGVPGERLSVVSRAEYAPVASNDDAEGRALNRRIEIRLLPDRGGAEKDAAPVEGAAADESGAASGADSPTS
ncbi:MAG: OmpA family protein [Deltaproteobacteria bacterium]|nr:OmpA family protein [Deltaproteobacteria bacterium]MBW2418502.1 OmpA family protein [Deltaproteobacteria bacterium]